MVTFALGET